MQLIVEALELGQEDLKQNQKKKKKKKNSKTKHETKRKANRKSNSHYKQPPGCIAQQKTLLKCNILTKSGDTADAEFKVPSGELP